MKYNYCTLFDSRYLSRAMAMYESLVHCASDFHLFIFAFDELSNKILLELDLPSATIISLGEFEDPELLEVKKTRSSTEYCWTCTPSIVLYSLKKFDIDHCTYIDADLYFYSDPKVLVEEMELNSILLTEHNYSRQYDLTEKSGKYCVQFMTFRNESVGLKALQWWRNACNEWCYQRAEDGKFGDQKYLDDWTERFEKVYVLKNRGAGVAPWNAEKFDLKRSQNKFIVQEKKTDLQWEMIFFHFHGLTISEEIYSLFNIAIFKNRILNYSYYKISKEFIDQVYTPYLTHLLRSGNELKFFGEGLNIHALITRHRKLESKVKRILTGGKAEL